MRKIVDNYTFDASAQQVTLTGVTVAVNRVVAVWNQTDGELIYYPATPGLGGTAAGSVITLLYDTTSMSDTDVLVIYYDDGVEPARSDKQDTGNGYLATLAGAVIAGDAPVGNGQPGVVLMAMRTESAADTSDSPGDAEPLQVKGGRLFARTTLDGAIPAGDNNIGNVDVVTVPADPFGTNDDAAATAGGTGSMSAKLRRATQGLEDLKTAIVLSAGNNNIGDVDVATLPALPAGTNVIGKFGIDQTTPDTTNAVSVIKTPKASSANTPSIGTSAGDAIASNSSRKAWGIQNLGTNTLYVRMATGASTTVFHFALKPGYATDDGHGGAVHDDMYTGVVSVAGTSPRYTFYEL